MKEPRKIVTRFVYPPIPDRSNDWCAFPDGEEEAGGYGWVRRNRRRSTTSAKTLASFAGPANARAPSVVQWADALSEQTYEHVPLQIM